MADSNSATMRTWTSQCRACRIHTASHVPWPIVPGQDEDECVCFLCLPLWSLHIRALHIPASSRHSPPDDVFDCYADPAARSSPCRHRNLLRRSRVSCRTGAVSRADTWAACIPDPDSGRSPAERVKNAIKIYNQKIYLKYFECSFKFE